MGEVNQEDVVFIQMNHKNEGSYVLSKRQDPLIERPSDLNPELRRCENLKSRIICYYSSKIAFYPP
jgi:hypothetical protein